MKKIQEFLSGKKTYIMMGVTLVIAIVMMSGHEIPNYVWVIDIALFGGAVKSAIKKTEPVKEAPPAVESTPDA